MKNTLRYLLIVVVGWLCSCSAWMEGPNAYEDEIRDAVSFHLAEADYIIEQANNPISLFLGNGLWNRVISDNFDEMESVFLDLYDNTDMYYSEVLESVSQDEASEFQKDAKKYWPTTTTIASVSPFRTTNRCLAETGKKVGHSTNCTPV